MDAHIAWDDADDPDPEDWTGPDDSIDEQPCPQCGAGIYEEAQRCPECGAWVIPGNRRPRSVWMLLVLAVLLAFVLQFVF